MRVDRLTIQDSNIEKHYKLSRSQSEKVLTYTDDYISWIESIGFRAPSTVVQVQTDGIEMVQEYRVQLLMTGHT